LKVPLIFLKYNEYRENECNYEDNFFFFLYNYNLFNIWFVQWSKMLREADLWVSVLVHLICPGKIQMRNCQLLGYILQNTKIFNIISYH
jgi:hypothetical protein